MRFSERYKFKPIREAIQIDSIDAALRNSLWSFLQLYIWDSVVTDRYTGGSFFDMNESIYNLFLQLWLNHFKLPVDTLRDNWIDTCEWLRERFFEFKWYEVYDFIEFVACNYPLQNKKNFIDACNQSMERECSAYRFVDRIITRITDEEEVESIEQALKKSKGPVRTHLQTALEKLSNREKPDYRNSIKESISAVESLVENALGAKGTLGKLTKKLEEDAGLHPALAKALNNLYGYTSDADGIRHAIHESEQLSFEDAKFFLVICSAFANLINSKFPGSK
jgi:hypothetical protein